MTGTHTKLWTSSLLCRFLGRLHDKTAHALSRQASEKRQGTKSRAGRDSVSRLRSMGICGARASVYVSRGACRTGIGMRFGMAAANGRRWRSIIERAPSAVANGQLEEWQEHIM